MPVLPEEVNTVGDGVLEERKGCIDACIVRILKARKTMEHRVG